ncbi:hypothetical protein [Bdellovibrio sp. BCCA]|uniref:hypothetical protein n=1 Tax=unclassified Bdellovibrio TaxID=2633795 RepID=UPI0025D48BB7|nr:hypothetical protein [uncultured Bdellovibrio sp.]
MERLNKIALILVFLLPLGCGVKGRPLPPLNPAPLGRGEPTFKDAQKKPTKKSTTRDQEDSSSAETEER